MNNRPGGFRLPAALLLLAVPLAVAVWGLGGFSAQRERNNADTQLIDSLNSAGGVYRRVLVERRLDRHQARKRSGACNTNFSTAVTARSSGGCR